jgi:hypothetical protein
MVIAVSSLLVPMIGRADQSHGSCVENRACEDSARTWTTFCYADPSNEPDCGPQPTALAKAVAHARIGRIPRTTAPDGTGAYAPTDAALPRGSVDLATARADHPPRIEHIRQDE